jgi:hypothetical protein
VELTGQQFSSVPVEGNGRGFPRAMLADAQSQERRGWSSTTTLVSGPAAGSARTTLDHSLPTLFAALTKPLRSGVCARSAAERVM